jgi:hypothetical protein
MLAVVMRYWRDCLVLMREGGYEKREGGGVRKEMWLYNHRRRGEATCGF